MKKLLALVLITGIGQLVAYDRVWIKNSTPFQAKIHIEYMVCGSDEFIVGPWQEAQSQASRGGCLVTKIWAEVTETAHELKDMGYGAMQAERKVVTSEAYTSSGTGYSRFQLLGPILQGDERKYYVSRFVD